MPHTGKNYCYTAEVFIVYKNKVLLRKHDKLGIWLSVGGHIEDNEDPNQAALREVKEEVGLDVEIDDSLRSNATYPDGSYELIPPHFLNVQKNSPKHDHITFVYFARANSDKIAQMVEREKSEDIKWFTKKELAVDTEIIENIKFYALKALEKLTMKNQHRVLTR